MKLNAIQRKLAQIWVTLECIASSRVDRMRSLKLARWLSEQENAVSILDLTPTALQAGLPKVNDYRGLQAIVELKRPLGDIEWYLFLATGHVADQNELRFSQTLGSEAVSGTRSAIFKFKKKNGGSECYFGGIASASSALASSRSNHNQLPNDRGLSCSDCAQT